MGKIMRWICIGWVALAVVVGIQAQEKEPLQVGVKVGTTYSDNRDGTDSDKEDNFDVFAQPRIDLILDDGQTSLDFFLAPSVTWRSNPRDNDEPSPQNDEDVYVYLGAVFQQKFSEATVLRLADDFSYTDDPNIDLGGVSVREDESHYYNAVRADFSTMLGETYGVQVLGANSIKRYDEDVVADEEDEDVYKVDGIFRVLLGNGLKGLAQVGYSDFENESTTVDRGAQIMTYAVGLEKDMTAKLKGVVKGGVQTVEYSNDELDSDTTGYGAAELMLSESATRVAVGVGYGFYGPYVRPYSSQTRTYVSAKVERDIGSKLTLAAEGQFGRGEYEKERISATQELPGGDDDMWLGALKGTYQVHRNVDLELGYQIEDWDSDVRESFTRNLVTAAVKASL